jgi:hypothetical protein
MLRCTSLESAVQTNHGAQQNELLMNRGESHLHTFSNTCVATSTSLVDRSIIACQASTQRENGNGIGTVKIGTLPFLLGFLHLSLDFCNTLILPYLLDSSAL